MLITVSNLILWERSPKTRPTQPRNLKWFNFIYLFIFSFLKQLASMRKSPMRLPPFKLLVSHLLELDPMLNITKGKNILRIVARTELLITSTVEWISNVGPTSPTVQMRSSHVNNLHEKVFSQKSDSPLKFKGDSYVHNYKRWAYIIIQINMGLHCKSHKDGPPGYILIPKGGSQLFFKVDHLYNNSYMWQ